MAKRKYDVNDEIFNVIDNQNKAYFLGLLYADGCNYDNGRVKIDLIEEDLEILQSFKDFLEYTGTIKYYDNSKPKLINGNFYNCKSQYRLQFVSKKISESLSKHGCISNKTYVLTFPTEDIVPLHLIRHFIRGYMDGDGGISYWIDNENTGHKKFNINFCGTTDIINTISKIISKKFHCCPSVTDRYQDRDNNNLQVSICGNRVVEKILDWLYDDANIYMQRKYNKYLELKEEIKRVNSDKKLYGSAHERRKVIRLSDLKIYDSIIESALDNGYKGASTITIRCQKRKDFMYLDEYEIERRNDGIR